MSLVVEVECLTKIYGQTTVLDEISFSLEADKIYGLLGRNGAGKTTLMHILTAQAFASRGTVRVFGEAPYENRRVLSQLCFIKESQRYPETYRVNDVMVMAACVFPHWDQAYASELLRDFQIPLKRRVKALSRGVLSAVGVTVGLASRAPLTIFDEPYLGLDAVNRGIFYDHLIADYLEHPRTMILSTHLIDEVSRLLEHVLVIDQGRLILNEEAEALRERACTLVGSAEKVAAFTSGKTLLGREQIGSLVAATLLGPLTGEERLQAERLGLEFTSVSLQQLIVHLTNGKAARALEVAR
jgi:ABC-2 type transport system ATP-binding protein